MYIYIQVPYKRDTHGRKESQSSRQLIKGCECIVYAGEAGRLAKDNARPSKTKDSLYRRQPTPRSSFAALLPVRVQYIYIYI